MPDAAPPSPVTTAWHTANVRQQVVSQLTAGGLPAAATEGRMFAVTDRDRYEFDTGAALVPGPPWAAAGRVGFNISRVATQLIPTGTSTFTAISWDTETTDNGGFITVTSDTITVPTGLAGLYDINGFTAWASSPGANSVNEILVNGSVPYCFEIGAGVQIASGAAFSLAGLALAAGDTVQLRVSQGSGGAINATAVLQLWRISA